MSCHASSRRSWASSCCPDRLGTISTGSGPSSTSNASASECAGSVDSTIVRSPSSAHRSAVAAAVVVLPTPPLPVKSKMRAVMRSALAASLQLVEGGRHDLALGPALDEPGQGHRQLDDELVRDLGAAGSVVGLEEVLAVEALHDVALLEHPAHPQRR